MRIKILGLLLPICCLSFAAHAQRNFIRQIFYIKPQIANQFHYAKGDKIVISYEITNVKPYRTVVVRPGLLSAGNDTINFSIMRSMSGDIGQLTTAKGRHEIVWDVFSDMENLPAKFDFKLKMSVIRLPIPSYNYLAYSGSTNAPFGLAYYRLKNWGFYGSAKFWRIARQINSEVNTDGSSDLDAIYTFGESRRTNSYSFTAGFNKWLGVFENSDIYLYFGGGYGVKQLLWERIELDSNLESVGSEWVVNADRNNKGPIVEAGFYVRNKLFFADLGIGVLDGKSFFINLGPAPPWNWFVFGNRNHD